jgi:putative protease
MAKAFANLFSVGPDAVYSPAAIELVCPVDTLAQLRAAVDNGADCVQLRFSLRNNTTGSDTKADLTAMADGIRYAHGRRCKVAVRLDWAPQTASWSLVRSLIDQVAERKVDAIELSSHELMLYAAAHHPQLQLHYAASNAIDAGTLLILKRHFNVTRVALPRLLSMADLISVSRDTPVDLELHGFSHFTSIVSAGKLQDAALKKKSAADNVIQHGENAEADQCGTEENAANDNCFSNQAPADIKVLRLLPDLSTLGVRAIRVEAGGLRPAQTAHIIQIWREAIDECMTNSDHYIVKPSWVAELNNAYRRQRSRQNISLPTAADE